jgi:hypothetical protein
MIKLYFVVIALLFFGTNLSTNAQCTTTDPTGGLCPDGTTECDLLPDITVSWWAIENYASGPDEYSQSGNGVNDGRLRITGSTPNIGYGPLTVRGSDYFVCGMDTLLGDPGVCADGSLPQQLITQRIYHKNNGVMTYYDRWAGAMTYHPTHGHNHVDDWGVFTLRLEDPNDPNPLNWAIVGDGAKLGFCLMDYGTCSTYPDHCKDINTDYMIGTTMLNGDFPNYGLGGGSYSCSPVEQGITSGYTDIYGEHLDGMWINIPPGTCNGDYWIVAEIDPHNSFLESDSTNNWTATPFTLTQQEPAGTTNFALTADNGTEFCAGGSTVLSAPAGVNYLWNTGETTQTITVSQAGTYTVDLTNTCGTGTSDPTTITILSVPSAPTLTGDTVVCMGQSTVLTSTGSNVTWFDGNGIEIGTGNTFTTPALTSDSTFYAESGNYIAGVTDFTGLTDTSNTGGGFFTNIQGLIFDVTVPLTIKSVKVIADGAGDRNIQLIDNGGNLLQAGTFTLPDGESQVDINFNIPAGINYQLSVNGASDLWRCNSGVNYPYEIVDTISIHSSTAGTAYYYFFFDWEITVGESVCSGPQSAQTIYVDGCSGVDDVDISASTSVYPNPNKGMFTFEFNVPGTASFEYKIVDVVGKGIYSKEVSEQTGFYKEVISLSGAAPGIYSVVVNLMGKTSTTRFVVE